MLRVLQCKLFLDNLFIYMIEFHEYYVKQILNTHDRSGLSIVGRDYYGVFPLKGKPLNVREATIKQVTANDELKNIVDIIGLKFGTEYNETNIKTLRYGHLMIMADQDHDGSHIKGLIINFLHFFWPSLLEVPGFLKCFITPIVKCTNKRKKKDVVTFFNIPQYESWRNNLGANVKNYDIKYYKGLGTSTSAEAKEYFSNLDIHEVHFSSLSSDAADQLDLSMFSHDEADVNLLSSLSGGELIDMAFSKKRVEERKTWLNAYRENTYLSYDAESIRYSNFINKELILFSRADNIRSLPNVFDGFKPSQRKVLFGCFKKNLKVRINSLINIENNEYLTKVSFRARSRWPSLSVTSVSILLITMVRQVFKELSSIWHRILSVPIILIYLLQVVNLVRDVWVVKMLRALVTFLQHLKKLLVKFSILMTMLF